MMTSRFFAQPKTSLVLRRCDQIDLKFREAGLSTTSGAVRSRTDLEKVSLIIEHHEYEAQ